jgi:hypothetical protein
METHNIEYKETWRDEYINGFVASQMPMVVKFILV